MKQIVDEITALTNEWYDLIGKDHHKDRDCHWMIEMKWSYGNSPIYTVIHYGYIMDQIDDQYPTLEEALIGLKNTLVKCIEQEKSTYESSVDGDGW